MLKCSYQFSVLFWPVTWHEEGRYFSKAVVDLHSQHLREGIPLSLQKSASRKETGGGGWVSQWGGRNKAEESIAKSAAIEIIPTCAIRMLWAWFRKVNVPSFEDACLNFSAFVKSSIRTRLLARVSQDRGERNSLPSSKWIISYWEKATLFVSQFTDELWPWCQVHIH